MGKIDTEAKVYLSNKERFCDIFNFWIYDGRNVIKPDGLNGLDTTALAIPYGNKARKHVQKYRDILRPYAAKHDDQAIFSRLISHLLALGKTDEIASATKNAVLRNQLYEKYSIS